MAKHRFVVAGSIETHAGASSPLAQNDAATAASELLYAIELPPNSRDAGVDQQTPRFDDTDLVEIAVDGGGHLWMSVAELR
ncbi:MAG: hypothetical protein ABI650_05970, partial [Dokdonella sp.]